MRATVLALVVVLSLASVAPAGAQPAGAPTNCAEATSTASTFIGHDCGEWATVMIVGRIVIREPWGRSLRTPRVPRVRERRAARGIAAPALAASSDSALAPGEECHPHYVECLPIVDDLNCLEPPIFDSIIHLRDPRNDAYGLDVNRGVGNGVGCDDEA